MISDHIPLPGLVIALVVLSFYAGATYPLRKLGLLPVIPPFVERLSVRLTGHFALRAGAI